MKCELDEIDKSFSFNFTVISLQTVEYFTTKIPHTFMFMVRVGMPELSMNLGMTFFSQLAMIVFAFMLIIAV